MMSLMLAAAGWASPLWAQEKIEAITRPSQDVMLSFVRPGRVAKVLVKEGDTVKAGQELIRLDDEAERVQLEQLKAQAEDVIRVKAADAQLAQRNLDLKKMEQAFRDHAATEMEVEHAKLDVTISELSRELAQFEQKQAVRKYEEAKIQLDRMRLLSPIDGKVERPTDAMGKPRDLAEEGESVDALEKIIRVVNVNPLWVDVPVPVEGARLLKRGQGKAEVEFEPGEATRAPRVAGNIIHIAALADAASGTLTVRVELLNPSDRPAGERVYVSFPPVKTAMRTQP
jgi:RND family efflux transporter MFP subunit